jgi:hypothetical protein
MGPNDTWGRTLVAVLDLLGGVEQLPWDFPHLGLHLRHSEMPEYGVGGECLQVLLMVVLVVDLPLP